MKFKGTPGPWINVGGWVDAVGNGIICSLSAVSVKQEDIDDANANLIAAAPDLLYSLQKLLTEYKFTRSQLNGDTEEDLVDVLCVHNAMAAINKALGRE